MSDPQDRLACGFIRSFKDIVDRVDPHDLVLELVQRRILPLGHMEQLAYETREENMMRLLGRIYRQSIVDSSTMEDFVGALDQINTTDPGHRYDDIIASLEVTGEDSINEYLPFNEVERRVFDCTRRVAEKSLEPDIFPALVSAGVVCIEVLEDILAQRDRLEQMHCLMEHIQREGSQAFNRFVHTLLESEDRSAIGVGTIMQECLQTQRESPYTPCEWLEHDSLIKQETSPECEAFQHAYCSMFTHISDCDPQLTLVNLLYSSGLFDRPTRDKVTDSRQQRVNQIRFLLRELEIMIEARPGIYQQLVSLLKHAEKHDFRQLATLLQQKFDEQVKGEVQDKEKCITLSEIETDSSSQQVSTEMSDYQELLRRYYMSTERQETMSQKWPGELIEQVIPTNLAMIKREKVYRSTADAFTQLTLHGNIDEIGKSKTPISKECLFEGSSRCIVAQGAAGIGKSMFGQELAHDWVNGTNTMKQFRLIHLVPLRSTCFHSVSSVCDLFHPKPSKAVEREILSSGGKGLLLILDGFDELPEKLQERNSIYGRLIRGEELPKARILITSRPKVVKHIEKIIGPGSMHVLNVEILGFQAQNIESCVQSTLADEAQQQAFMKYIDDNLVIKNMMYIPLHTAIVIELFKQKLSSSDENSAVLNCAMTLTELFRDLCRCLLYRDIACKLAHDMPSFEQLQLECLPEAVQNSFETLSLLAFTTLARQKLVFDKLPANFDHMGFMRSITVQSQEPFSKPYHSYSFHHLTIQEFLAAFYLWRTQPPRTRLEMIQQLPEDHQSMVLRFLAGLSQFRNVGWPEAMETVGICLDSQGNRGCNSTLLNCLFEAQDTQACKEVFPSGYTINYSPMTSTQFDCFALGYCIANSGRGCKWKLCAIGGDGLGAIAAGLHSVQSDPCGSIDLIKISYGGENIHNLGLLPDCILQDIRELNLSNSGLNDEACMWLSKFLPSLSSLRQFDIGDNPFTGGSAGNIFVALSKLNGFQYMDLLHAQLDEADINALHTLVKKNGTLKNLIIGRCQMPPSLVEKMVDIVLADSSLENISFMNIDFPRLATHLAKRLKSNTTLTSIMLWDRSFCTDGALTLLSSLHTNDTLASMTLMPWYKDHIPTHILSQPAVQRCIQWFIYPQRKK